MQTPRFTTPVLVLALNGVLSSADGRAHRCHIMDATFFVYSDLCVELVEHAYICDVAPHLLVFGRRVSTFGALCGHTPPGPYSGQVTHNFFVSRWRVPRTLVSATAVVSPRCLATYPCCLNTLKF